MSAGMANNAVVVGVGIAVAFLGFWINTHTRRIFLLDLFTFAAMLAGIGTAGWGLWLVLRATL
jgi:hypothetical protein